MQGLACVLRRNKSTISQMEMPDQSVTLSRAQLEELKASLSNSLGEKVTSVDCPSGVKVEKGTTFECTVKVEKGAEQVATQPASETLRDELRKAFKIIEVKKDKTYFIPPETWWDIYKTIFNLDPNSLVHGVMFAKEQIKISRLLTAHLEAFGAARVGRSGPVHGIGISDRRRGRRLRAGRIWPGLAGPGIRLAAYSVRRLYRPEVPWLRKSKWTVLPRKNWTP